jgi:hypothetical protein
MPPGNRPASSTTAGSPTGTDPGNSPDSTVIAPLPSRQADEPTKPPAVGERFRDKVYVALIIALLSFAGAPPCQYS